MEKKEMPDLTRGMSVICFTRNGEGLCRRIVAGLREMGVPARGYGKGSFLDGAGLNGDSVAAGMKAGGAGDVAGLNVAGAAEGSSREEITRVLESLEEWTGAQFERSQGLIFIGAAGIAVRAVSRWIRDKFQDPAVVVVDERARFAIPILSGHAGGANALATELGRMTGALPVITTATDVQGLFAVDVFAREQGLGIHSRRLAKEISAALLAGERVGFFSDFPIEGEVPKECAWNQKCRRNIVITVRRPKEEGSLCLVPKAVTLGIGCRRGIRAEQIKEGVSRFLEAHRIFSQSISQVASIDRKETEEGLCRFCYQMGWSLTFFSAEELKGLLGAFSHSDFVERVTGVGNVCERAAVMGSGGGFWRLIQRKEQFDGVTVAAALSDWKVIM